MSEPHVADAPEVAEQVPPLGLKLLFLWTVCSAILLTIYRLIRNTIIGTFGGLQARQQNYYRFHDAYASIVEGLAICTLAIWLDRRRRGLPFPVEAGEWLLVTLGIATIMETSAMATWVAYYARYGDHDNMMLMRYLFLSSLLIVGLCFTCVAYHTRLPRWWRIEIVCIAGLWFTWFMYHLAKAYPTVAKNFPGDYRLLTYYCNFPTLGLFICLAIDRWKRISHGWLHYVGVSVFALKLWGEMAVDALQRFFV